MRRNVWILNHYASSMYLEKGGRHYWFAEKLKEKGYNPTILCANTVHNSGKYLNMRRKKYTTKICGQIPFVFFKTCRYKKNGLKRMANMISFYFSLLCYAKRYAEETSFPDIIIASSVHPLTCLAGLKLAQKMHIPCIVEIRDLWPETFVSMGTLKKNCFFAKIMYSGERWIYTKADAIVFTMEGGKSYIVEKKWDVSQGGKIKLDKVYTINNGIDLEEFDKNVLKYPAEDEDLCSDRYFNIVYTGSLREANQMEMIVDVADELKNYPKIRFLLWGNGDRVDKIQSQIKEKCLTNIKYKGVVKKCKVPGILVQSDANLRHYKFTDICRFGSSLNKEFEYLAAGRPIISTVKSDFSYVEKNSCGVEVGKQDVKAIAEKCRELFLADEKRKKEMGQNARRLALQYDFSVLTEKLITIIEKAERGNERKITKKNK